MIIEANTAKEKMEALLAGKEVWQNGAGFRLSDDGEMQIKSDCYAEWENTDGEDLYMNDRATTCVPSTKYTFCQALGMMAQGKAMSPVGSKDRYIIYPEKGLVYRSDDDSMWLEPPLLAEETDGMWVEADE